MLVESDSEVFDSVMERDIGFVEKKSRITIKEFMSGSETVTNPITIIL